MNQRNSLIDVLKGMAIVAVILYHAKVMPMGYLGVEVFLVISGFLTTKSLLRALEENRFSYLGFLRGRLARLWPLVLLVSIVALAVGIGVMLPGNLKNTCEGAAASGFFLNNVVQWITSSNYWDVSNDYKPLMHTWYVGVLFQFYLVYPLLLLATYRLCGRRRESVHTMLLVVSGLSLILYLSPWCTQAFAFHHLPTRLFEFTLGGLLAVPAAAGDGARHNRIVALLVLIGVVCVLNYSPATEKYTLLATVLLTLAALCLSLHHATAVNVRSLAALGRASLSLYLWHQLFYAFYRYIINDHLSIAEHVMLLAASVIVGMASYRWVEQPLARISKDHSRRVVGLSFAVAVVLCGVSGKIYMQHGVLHDVPELSISKSKPETWEPQDYNSKVEVADTAFVANGRKNVLVVGDSFGRDWFNILREQGKDTLYNMVYHREPDSTLRARIDAADIIFLATSGEPDKYFDYIPQMLRKAFHRIGDKQFFTSAGVVYNRCRFAADTKQKGVISRKFRDRNAKDHAIFGDKHFDLMQSVSDASGRFSLFTPEGKLISHDGIHLTRDGAKYYATIVDTQQFFR